jgi:hypothetical protein
MLGRLARIVLAMFGKLYGKAVHGAFMNTCNKTLYYLFGYKFKIIVLG